MGEPHTILSQPDPPMSYGFKTRYAKIKARPCIYSLHFRRDWGFIIVCLSNEPHGWLVGYTTLTNIVHGSRIIKNWDFSRDFTKKKLLTITTHSLLNNEKSNENNINCLNGFYMTFFCS